MLANLHKNIGTYIDFLIYLFFIFLSDKTWDGPT